MTIAGSFIRPLVWTLLPLLQTAPPDPDQPTPTLFEWTGRFAQRRLAESSGIAVSRRHPGLLWTHNDSGDGPFLYATNLRGDNLGVYTVTGASATDWEDVAPGPCPNAAGWCLYIADTGDNLERRRDAAIYIVEEPPVPARGSTAATARAHALRIRFPDRPRDVEAMAVAPDGEIILISKGRSERIRSYHTPPGAARQDTATLRPGGRLGIEPNPTLGREVTGAALSEDGRLLVVRTYTELYFYRRDADGGLHRLGRPCWIGPREPQGEAVGFLDEYTLVLTSESAFGRVGGIARVRCPLPEPRR